MKSLTVHQPDVPFTKCAIVRSRAIDSALYVSLIISDMKSRFIFVSLHGVRVVTERAWKPGERVIVKSYHGSIQSRARVIYCHHLAKKRYAVGLELHSAVGMWADVSQPARAEA